MCKLVSSVVVFIGACTVNYKYRHDTHVFKPFHPFYTKDYSSITAMTDNIATMYYRTTMESMRLLSCCIKNLWTGS